MLLWLYWFCRSIGFMLCEAPEASMALNVSMALLSLMALVTPMVAMALVLSMAPMVLRSLLTRMPSMILIAPNGFYGTMRHASS